MVWFPVVLEGVICIVDEVGMPMKYQLDLLLVELGGGRIIDVCSFLWCTFLLYFVCICTIVLMELLE